MDITIIFERVFGLYLIISGILVLARKEEMLSLVKMFGKDQALRYSMGGLITLGGLFMTVSYYDWSTIASSIITIAGWVVLAKGLVFFCLSDKKVQKLVTAFNNSALYTGAGVVALIAGGYLTLVGFRYLV